MIKHIPLMAALGLLLTAMPCLAQTELAPDTTPPLDNTAAPVVPPANDQQAVEPLPQQPPAEAQAQVPPAKSTPTFLQNESRNSAKKSNRRTPSAQAPQQSEATAQPQPTGTQLAFFELTPAIGSISIKGVSTFSLGTNLSFHITSTSPFYFEPSIFISFLSGDTNTPNSMLFHFDGGVRYDFVIANSPLVPFLKVAVGPTIGTSSTTMVHGEKVSNGYLNAFAGGGTKVLISPSIAARADVGITLQGTDTGIYAMGAVALPL